MTPLCELAIKYGCDKTPSIKHSYTPYYHELLKGRDVRRVLEIGIYKGASLRMWRDYFPNAMIYGIDNDPKYLITENRISSYLCDQARPWETGPMLDYIGGKFDLIIDDGSHNLLDQKISYWSLFFGYLKPGGVYVIEDVQKPADLSEYIAADHHIECFGPLPPFNDDCLIVIEKGTHVQR